MKHKKHLANELQEGYDSVQLKVTHDRIKTYSIKKRHIWRSKYSFTFYR